MKKVFDNENDTPEVGKFYNVRCAKLVNGSHHFFVPIIGIEHCDPQFGKFGQYMHFHRDGRFMKNDTIHGYSNDVVISSEEYDGYSMHGIHIKLRKCLRLTTGLLPPEAPKNVYSVWYETMIGKSCAGKKCPHLGTTMMEQDGRLVCPLHSLQGSLETNKIVEYLFPFIGDRNKRNITP